MADEKISALVDAGAPQNTDQFVVARSGSTLSALWSSLEGALNLGTAATHDATDFDSAGAAAAAQAASQPLDADLTAIAAFDSSTSGAIASDGAGWIKKTYTQFKTALSLVAADVGLGNVTNDAQLKIASNLSDLNNAGTARTNLGLGTLATQSGTFSGTSSGTNTGDQTTVSGNAGTATALQTARNIDGQSFDGTANITVVAPGTHAATGKTTPVDADELPLVDSAASNVLKKLTWANVKATMKAYTDTLYPAGSGTCSGTNTGDQTLSDATISTTDITTNNASTAKHGFLPKLDNTASHALDGTGAWSNPVGTQLDYVEITASVTLTSTADGTSGGTSVIAGNAVSYDGSTRICIEFWADAGTITPGADGRQMAINLYEGTADLGRIDRLVGGTSGKVARAPLTGKRFLTPTNASHTYTIRGWKDNAADTASVLAGAGGASTDMPAFMRITKA